LQSVLRWILKLVVGPVGGSRLEKDDKQAEKDRRKCLGKGGFNVSAE